MSARRTPAQSAAARHRDSYSDGRVANQILDQFRFSQPSTNMTMTAFLDERGQLHTIDAFRVSLATPGASMRRAQQRDRRRPLGGRHGLTKPLR